MGRLSHAVGNHTKNEGKENLEKKTKEKWAQQIKLKTWNKKEKGEKGKENTHWIFFKSLTILPTRWPQKAPHLEATSSWKNHYRCQRLQIQGQISITARLHLNRNMEDGNLCYKKGRRQKKK
jgi:hypothetical protein